MLHESLLQLLQHSGGCLMQLPSLLDLQGRLRLSTLAPLLKRWKIAYTGTLAQAELGLPAELVLAVKGVYEKTSEGRHLMAENPETGGLEATGFCVGDLLLYTANDWRRNLHNGCLGELIEVFDRAIKVNLGSDEIPDMCVALGRAVYEGVDHYVLDSDVDAMEHAYAITVHKSQGSQFTRVIVPVRKSRVLDRTVIYTAVTRAQVQVILVGDVVAVEKAIALPPNAFSRQVGLAEMMAA